MIVEFFPIDVSSETNVQGKEAILLFGRTKDGKKICVLDSSYEPYFYVFPRRKEDIAYLKTKIEELKIEQPSGISFVSKIEIMSMRYFDRNVDVLKVFFRNQRDLDEMKVGIKEMKDVLDIKEGDLLLSRKYLIDKDITPLSLYRVTGEIIERSFNVDFCLKAESIELVDAEVLDTPKTIGFDIEVYCEESRYPVMERDPILMISLYSNYGFKKVITWKKFSSSLPLIFVDDEANLLIKFEELLYEQNPDYLVGYFSDGFDLPYILARAKKHKLHIKLGEGFRVAKRGELSVAKLKGIIHLDIFKFIKNIMGGSLKLESYSLRNVASELLEERKLDINIADIGVIWNENPQELQKIGEYNLQDAKLALLLCEKILPNLNELVRLTGQPLFDICRSSYSQLVERYFMKRAKEFNEIYPNKPGSNEVSWRRMYSYEGAFVYEPKPGLYENIAVLDYRSLYPSLIVAKNISPSTLTEERKEIHETPSIELEGGKRVRYAFSHRQESFIAQIIKDLILRRNRVKEIIKKEGKKNVVLEARSYGLKTIANATYGYFGFFGARWYCRECAASITAFGREYIQDVIKKAEKSGFPVIYGDTDSTIIILQEKTKEDVFRFLEDVNKELPSLMEVELEDFYTRGIFVMKKGEEKGAKKKYALLSEKGDIKVVGFETIRRDWSVIAREVQKRVLEIFLKENSIEHAVEYVRNVIQDVKEEKIAKEKMIIQTQLKKKISSYDLVGPHVSVAKRMSALGEYIGPGSIIKYIVTKGRGLVRDKARIPEESIDYDPDYYIKNQIVPAVERIFYVVGYSIQDLLEGREQSKLQRFWKNG